jgi:phosphatidate phosphatase LPIN
LSGAIDVVVVEQENGDLACSPFHVRFGKLSLLLPSEKKAFLAMSLLTQVEFRVNGEKVDYAMKLGEGGEAFFVFQTDGEVPEDMQTSPIVSPDQSPVLPGAIQVPSSGVC